MQIWVITVYSYKNPWDNLKIDTIVIIHHKKHRGGINLHKTCCSLTKQNRPKITWDKPQENVPELKDLK